MRPVNQLPLSLKEMKRSPLASSRNPDSPPKPGKGEVRISPLRYSSLPNRTWERSRVSNDGSGWALTSIATGAVTEGSSGRSGFAGGCVADCACAPAGISSAESPAAVDVRKRRRLIPNGIETCSPKTGAASAVSPLPEGEVASVCERVRDYALSSGLNPSPGAPRRPLPMGEVTHRCCLRMQFAPRAGRRRRAMGLAEQLGELFGDGAAEFLGIHDGDRAAIIARDVVADADRDQLDRRAGLDFLDDVAQMTLQVVAGIDRQRGVVDRRAVGNHHQDL